MYSEKDILARLQRGEKAEDIAKEMTAQLNAAVDQKKKVDAEKAEVEAKKQASAKHLETAANAINAYLKEWFPSAAKRGVTITPEDVREMIATVVETDDTLGCVSEMMSKILKDVKKTTSADPLASFFKRYGL